jgi:hypothetical protein
MCLVIKMMIADRAFPIKQKFLKKLGIDMENILQWLYKNDISNIDGDEKFDIDIFYQECTIKINSVNDQCAQLHHASHGININYDENIINKVNNVMNIDSIELTGLSTADIDPKSSKQMGTSILDIVRQRQIHIIQEMLEDGNDDIKNNDTIADGNIEDNNICVEESYTTIKTFDIVEVKNTKLSRIDNMISEIFSDCDDIVLNNNEIFDNDPQYKSYILEQTNNTSFQMIAEDVDSDSDSGSDNN